MAVLPTATASGRVLFAGLATTTQTVVYTAPALNANITTPSATAYIKEISLCNTTATAATVTIIVNGYALLSGLTVGANDTKVLSGLNTMIPAGATIQLIAGTASAINVYISGVEIQ